MPDAKDGDRRCADVAASIEANPPGEPGVRGRFEEGVEHSRTRAVRARDRVEQHAGTGWRCRPRARVRPPPGRRPPPPRQPRRRPRPRAAPHRGGRSVSRDWSPGRRASECRAAGWRPRQIRTEGQIACACTHVDRAHHEAPAGMMRQTVPSPGALTHPAPPPTVSEATADAPIRPRTAIDVQCAGRCGRSSRRFRGPRPQRPPRPRRPAAGSLRRCGSCAGRCGPGSSPTRSPRRRRAATAT